MNTEDHLIQLMRYLDGELDALPENTFQEEVDALKEILFRLRDLPQEVPDVSTDQRVNEYIQSKEKHNNHRVLHTPWWSYALLAASLALLLYLLIPISLEDKYNKLRATTDKISFIHELYTKTNLSDADIHWLQELIIREKNPNLKVTILDLMETRAYPLHEQYQEWLLEEHTPVVQLALLETMGKHSGKRVREGLEKFGLRQDLDPTVRARIQEITQNIKRKE